jgi:hypothetical protein
MFSRFLCINDTICRGFIDILTLRDLIKNNPSIDRIEYAQSLPINSKREYDEVKAALPSIMPNCIVRNASLLGDDFGRNFVQSSGYIYFDIDNLGSDEIAELKLKLANVATLISKSLSGRGVSILFKHSTNVLSQEHFNQLHKVFRDTFFSDIAFDTKSCNLNRMWVIPQDSEMEFNPNALVDINLEYSVSGALERDESATQGILPPHIESCSVSEGEEIRYKPNIEVENRIVDIKKIPFPIIKIPKQIKDETKHKLYAYYVNVLIYNNRNISVSQVIDEISKINWYYARPRMDQRRLEEYVDFVYNQIKDTPDYNFRFKVKNLHFNPQAGISRREKIVLANQINGRLRKCESLSIINAAKNRLISEGKTPTPKLIKEYCDGLSIRTIRKYWKEEIETVNDVQKLYNDNHIPVLLQAARNDRVSKLRDK